MTDDETLPPTASRRTFLAGATVTMLAGCSGISSSGEDTPTVTTDGYDHPTPSSDPDWEVPTGSPLSDDLTVETLVENLDVPWDISFTGTGEMFVTQRTGSLVRLDSGDVAERTELPGAIDAGSVEPGSDESSWWVEGGEGGTLGVATHPDYPNPEFVYVYYTTTRSGTRTNRVVRYDMGADDPTSTAEPIVTGISANNYHNGGRIAFGPDDALWITTGDAGDPELASDPGSLAGKILRVGPDGSGLSSNPDLDGDPRVFTYGHRNPQGLVWLPSGVPVATEHGPAARDEVSVLRAGGFYGWPEARCYPGNSCGPDQVAGPYVDHDDAIPPVLNNGSSSSWAPTGATFYTGEDVPAWRNRLVMGGLISQSIWVVTLTPSGYDLPPIDGEARRFDEPWMDDSFTATAHRLFQDELGRVRLVTQSPDGDVYAITSNRDGRAQENFPREKDDVLVRITAD